MKTGIFCKDRPFWRAPIIWLLGWVLSGTTIAVGQDAKLYVVGKTVYYNQDSSGSPALWPEAFYPWEGVIAVLGLAQSEYSQVTLTAPDGTIVPFFWSPDDGQWDTAEDLSFQTQAELDAVAPDSTTAYSYSFTPATGSVIVAPLLLNGPAYPTAPHISNYAATQAIDPNADFTLFWDAFPGGTADDTIIVEVYNSAEQQIFATPFPEMEGELDGTATSAVIPAGTMAEGRTYEIEVTFYKIVDRNATSLPGAVGLAFYGTSTSLMARTVGEAVGPETTELFFIFEHEPGTIIGETVSVPDNVTTLYWLEFWESGDANPPASVTFTGPGGSQFETATASEATFPAGSGRMGYSSPRTVTGPPPAQFPPGGLYTVGYGDLQYDFQMPDPNAADRMFVAIPTFVLNDAREITSLTWTYRTPAGAPMPLDPSITRLHVAVRSIGMDQGSDVAVSATEFVLGTPVPTANLVEIEFVAEDDQGNVFRSSHLPAPVNAPSIEVHPQSYTVAPGSSVTFTVRVSGQGTMQYQWRKDGADLPGATLPSLTLDSVSAADAGAYSVVVSNGLQAVSESGILTVSAEVSSYLVNLSNRGNVGTDDEIMIPGFVVSGTGTKKLLIRVVGPTLGTFGVTGALADPQLRLFSGGAEIAANDNWGSAANAAEVSQVTGQVGAFALDSESSADSAILVDLGPGSYTVQAAGVGNTTGVALVEIYDADTAATPSARLVNISNRGFVGSGDAIMIPGFVVSGSAARTFLIRAVGPTLASFGVEGVLDDPMIQVFSGSQPVADNDDWWQQSTANELIAVANQIGAFELQSGSRDAALLITLNPGSYTVQASGKAGTTGVALLEIYEVP